MQLSLTFDLDNEGRPVIVNEMLEPTEREQLTYDIGIPFDADNAKKITAFTKLVKAVKELLEDQENSFMTES